LTVAPLVVAVSKGRTVGSLVPVLERAGLNASVLLRDDRSLIREAGGLRFLLLKADDVPTYVEHGAADLGICGRDVLRESDSDLLVPLDLGFGRCRMVVAASKPLHAGQDLVRVATKYPRTAAEHFAARGVQVEVIEVAGSAELGPVAGLADVIVDLVETGETLRQNGLEIVEEVSAVTTVLAVNRAAYKLRRAEIVALVDRLRAARAGHGAPPSVA
jgi:ATP phosphoribosyltransferase